MAPSFSRTASLASAFLVVAVVACLSLAFAAAPASATPTCTKPLIESKAECQFGAEGQEAGEFKNPTAITVDQGSGDVYVVDRENSRVEKFSATGEFLLAWGWGVADGEEKLETCGPATATVACLPGKAGSGTGQFNEPGGVAVDEASHDVYVEDIQNHRVEKFTPSGEFVLMFGGEVNATTHENVCVAGESCQAGVQGSGEGQFLFLPPLFRSIAVDSTGTVYVGDKGRVQEFTSGGLFVKQVLLLGLESIEALAVDSAKDLYVTSSGVELTGEELPGVREYDQTGAELGVCDPEARPASTVIALGAGDELFVNWTESLRINEFEAGCVQLASFDVRPVEENARGMVFGDSSNVLYVLLDGRVRLVPPPLPGPLLESVAATAEPQGTATVSARINPEGKATEYHLDYGLEASSETATAPVVMGGAGFEGETVEVKLTGLQPGASYHYHFVAENTAGKAESEDATFTALPPVGVDSESVSQVSATGARLSGLVNPLSLASEYRFEYDTVPYGEGEAPHGTRVPETDASAGSGVGDVAVSVLIESLHPGTTYHYRIVAHSSFGETRGPDRSFTTQSGAGAGLIDARGWEQVSPVDKHGSALEAITLEGGLIQASEDGSGIAYIAKAPVDEEAQGVRSFAEQQLLATRTGPGVWGTKDIATPHEAVAGLKAGELSEYRMFSPDLTAGIVEPTGATPLSPEAGERTPYRRETSGLYTPLVTPGNVTPPGTKYGGRGEANSGGVEFVTATPDLSHVLISTLPSLTESFPGGTKQGELSLYEWFDGTLQPVSILPGGASAVAQHGARVGDANFQMRHAISSDGSRVVFESEEHHLFMRDVARDETVQLDVPQEGAEGGAGEAVYQDASSNGDRVFFTDEARLTTDATSRANQPDLYMCEAANTSGERSCAEQGALKDLTVDSHTGEAANVAGAVIGASEDGSQIYFVAEGVLTEAENDRAEKAIPHAPNLYEIDTNTGARTLVAVLSGQDSPDWQAGAGIPGKLELPYLTSRVSSDGRFLSFMSQRSLTGFDNRDVASGVPDEEVFLYDSSSRRLVCASCDPTGARPAGVRDPAVNEAPLLIDRPFAWHEQWLAASIPGWTSERQGIAQYQSRYLSNEGRLFFDSPVGLVPGDANGRQDVYEFEPEGLGGCTSTTSTATTVYVKELDGSPVGGCVGLISSGSSHEESAFLDASGMGPGGHEGEDVFFLTSAQLSHGDGDTALDVYDAHICSTALPCPSGVSSVPPACSNTDSCRPAAAPQPEVFGAPASATFHGPGNLTAAPPAKPKPKTAAEVRAEKLKAALAICKRRYKHQKKRRIACERQAHKAYGAKTSRTKRKGR